MKLLAIILLFSAAATAVVSAARAGGRPKLRNFSSAAEAQVSVKQLQQTVGKGGGGQGASCHKHQPSRHVICGANP